MRALIPAILIGLALWFVLRDRPEWPLPPRADLAGMTVDAAPLRPLRQAPNRIDVGGASLRCSDCHALFDSGQRQKEPIGQHQDVRLDHGRNDNCLSCHDQHDRNLLRDSAGVSVPFEQSHLLCAGCHGPTWRDWETGIHGRTNGSWDASSGLQTRLTCIECHDPHAPAIRGLSLFPGPNTLRMGDRAVHDGDHGGQRNPLHQWRDHEARRSGALGPQLQSESEHAKESHDG